MLSRRTLRAASVRAAAQRALAARAPPTAACAAALPRRRFAGQSLSNVSSRGFHAAKRPQTRQFASESRQTSCGLHIATDLPHTFGKILIANRGEIACRVIRTCRELGVKTVAIYSDADRDALHVRSADEAYRVGENEAAKSYLLGDRILAIAQQAGAQAIHPGYGFLSENEGFARKCADAGVVFIGPPASAIEAMGDKSASKTMMSAAGVPVVPGYHGAEQGEAELQARAADVGYPLMIKAVLGGGGKGMRVVHEPKQFVHALREARGEAMASFGDDQVLLERFIERSRHVEFQVFADTHGEAVHLWERDCSVQRRAQKILEESPAPGMTPELRDRMGQSAVDAAKAAGYVGAGTVEFIVDANTDEYFFMEMNTRLQVEHPVTEMLVQRDLVQLQLHVAAGFPMPFAQGDVQGVGHALEARIYAEDPSNSFLPCVGTISHLASPAMGVGRGVRVETGVRSGDEISMFYDPMIAKLVVHGPDRAAALHKMTDALEAYHIAGLKTNVPFLKRAVTHEAFTKGGVDTNFCTDFAAALHRRPVASPAIVALTAFGLAQQASRDWTAPAEASGSNESGSAWTDPNLVGWRLNLPTGTPVTLHMQSELEDAAAAPASADAAASPPHATVVSSVKPADGMFAVQLGGADVQVVSRVVSVEKSGKGGRVVSLDASADGVDYRLTIVTEGDAVTVFAEGEEFQFFLPSAVHAHQDPRAAAGGPGAVAPISGKVVAVHVEKGQQVKKGDPLVVLTAMKMQHTLRANADGTVASVLCMADEQVERGQTLVAVDPSADEA